MKKLLIALGALLALLLAALGGGLLYLDRILLAAGKSQLAALSARAGRPLTVDGIATKLLGGVGVRVTGLAVGAGAGEQKPLAALQRAELEIDLWRAVTSRGKDVEVRQAVLEGLRVDVLRFPDGTTNLERLLAKLEETAPKPAETQPAEKPKEGAGTPLDVSGLRIAHAGLKDGRVAFLDLATPGAKELFVDHLDLSVDDLAAGKPLEVKLAAAVLASAQNLRLTVRTAPLPPSLVPVATGATLKLEPVDLSPLLPFLPASVGLRSGTVRADVDARLGAAVEGGSGPTAVKGLVAATGLAFAAQQGGQPFAAALDLDVDGDAAAGDVRITRLDVTVGPAGLTGRGRLVGLRGDAPRAEGLEIAGRNLDLEALAALAPPLRRALGGATVAGPIGLTLRGGGSAGAQKIALAVDLGPVRLAVPNQLAKAAGAPAGLQATLDLAGGSRVRFEAALDLGGADLRPGGTLAKKPGDRFLLSARGTARSAGGMAEAAVEALTLDLAGQKLTGKAAVTSGPAKGGVAPVRFEASASGDRLDLDALLLPAPAAAPAAPPAATPASTRATASAANPYAGLSGVATLDLGSLRSERVEMQDVRVKVEVTDDLVTLSQARLAAFGGTVKADGSTVRLAGGGQPVALKLEVAGVGGQALLGRFSKHDLLDGRIDATVALSGQGLSSKALLPSLSGNLGGALAGGVFKGLDVAQAVTAPLAKRLPFAARALDGLGKGTALGKTLAFSLTVADGKARLAHPLAFETGRGQLTVEGTIGLDGLLDLPATLALSPEAVSQLTLGKVKLAAPLPIAFRLAGPASAPRVEGLALDGAVKALAAAAAGAVLKGAGVDTAQVKQEAEAKVAEARAKAEAEARKAAESAKKRLQDEAKKKLQDLFK